MSACSGIVDSCPNNLTGVSAQVFLGLINTLFAAKCSISDPSDYPADISSTLQDQDEFDFIIIGAGSAGSTVANKLSENPNFSILLIEAGTTPSSTSEIPALLANLEHTVEDWAFTTEPAANSCLGSIEGRCAYPRGKVLGGTSTINGMVYFRGQKQDYDQWAAAGNTGWDYDSVLPIFQELEAYQSDIIVNVTTYGTTGFQAISFADTVAPVITAAEAAGAELGLPINVGEADLGVTTTVQTVDHGLRANTAKEFLGPIQNRTNLKVSHNTIANKVVINNGKAESVVVTINGQTLTLNAAKEVIVSAGTIKSPQILILSGIGPQDHLEELGIPVIANLTVGDNLQDHVAFQGFFAKVSAELTPGTNTNDEFYNLLAHREGFFTSAPLFTFVTFINTLDNSTFRSAQIQHSPHPINDTSGLGAVLLAFGLSTDIVDNISAINAQSPLLALTPFYVHPQSRGTIRLNSTDPNAAPLIQTGFLTDPRDAQGILQSIRFLEEYIATDAFAEFSPEVVDLQLPQCAGLAFDSDDYWICLIEVLGTPGYHPAGTCKMDPTEGVVDPRLRVHGIPNLRVIDASIMPAVTGSNTNAPSILIGRKGAQLILEDYQSS